MAGKMDKARAAAVIRSYRDQGRLVTLEDDLHRAQQDERALLWHANRVKREALPELEKANPFRAWVEDKKRQGRIR